MSEIVCARRDEEVRQVRRNVGTLTCMFNPYIFVHDPLLTIPLIDRFDNAKKISVRY
jgi:hypothetical protein